MHYAAEAVFRAPHVRNSDLLHHGLTVQESVDHLVSLCHGQHGDSVQAGFALEAMAYPAHQTN
jgi:hypothetical protein